MAEVQRVEVSLDGFEHHFETKVEPAQTFKFLLQLVAKPILLKSFTWDAKSGVRLVFNQIEVERLQLYSHHEPHEPSDSKVPEKVAYNATSNSFFAYESPGIRDGLFVGGIEFYNKWIRRSHEFTRLIGIIDCCAVGWGAPWRDVDRFLPIDGKTVEVRTRAGRVYRAQLIASIADQNESMCLRWVSPENNNVAVNDSGDHAIIQWRYFRDV